MATETVTIDFNPAFVILGSDFVAAFSGVAPEEASDELNFTLPANPIYAAPKKPIDDDADDLEDDDVDEEEDDEDDDVEDDDVEDEDDDDEDEVEEDEDEEDDDEDEDEDVDELKVSERRR